MYGVYIIKNTKENKYYVGSSIFPEFRVSIHKSQLLENIHSNKELQGDFNKFGMSNFVFEIISDNLQDIDLKNKEQEYIEKLNSKLQGYNKYDLVKIYKKKNSENQKNVKIDFDVHHQLKIVSTKTGISIGKLVEMGVIKIIDEFKEGEFDKLVNVQKKIRRDGSISR